MRWSDRPLYVAGTGVCLAPRVTVDDAIAQGLCDPEHAPSRGWRAAAVAAPDLPAADMAVAAARDALAASAHGPDDIGTVLHAVVLSSGLDAWSSTSYLTRKLGISHDCRGLEIRAGCAGALSALDAACSMLQHADLPAALITAADVWPLPIWDRWRGTTGDDVSGDGAGALVLSRAHGLARVLATATTSDSALEPHGRGPDPLRPWRDYQGHPISLADRAQPFFDGTMSRREFVTRSVDAVRRAVARVLADADLTLADVDRFAFQFAGERPTRRDYVEPLGLSLERTTFDLGLDIGHLGAADPLVGLHHVLTTDPAAHRILTAAAGGGFTWSVALFERT